MKKIQTCNKGTKHLAFIPLTVWQGARNAEHVTETEFEGVFSVTNYPPLTSHLFRPRSILVYRRWILLTISIPPPATANIRRKGLNKSGDTLEWRAERDGRNAQGSRATWLHTLRRFILSLFSRNFSSASAKYTARKLTISLDATPFTYRRHVPRFLFFHPARAINHSPFPPFSLAFDLLFRRVIFVSRLETPTCLPQSFFALLKRYIHESSLPPFLPLFNNQCDIFGSLFLDYVSFLFCFHIITRYWNFSDSFFYYSLERYEDNYIAVLRYFKEDCFEI